MKFFTDWLDQRTGYRKLLEEALREVIPGGSRWRYVWGSALSFAFIFQVITGIFLWMHYSPSAQTAWESVFFIQTQVPFGWLLRGMHHFMADVMMVLLVLHLTQVFIDRAYAAPREVNFIFGVALMGLTLALALTGYLLPWDQKGYWATKVATSIVGLTPVIGPDLQRVVVGGAEYGHHTLTHFFALHAGVLPILFVLLVVGHIALFRRHGIKAKEPYKKPTEFFWPDQVLKDAVAALAVMLAVGFLSVKTNLLNPEAMLGAELTAPADPSNPYPARPEWYFLFLFQFIELPPFRGEGAVLGAIIIPTLTMGFLCLMPFWGRWKVGHFFNTVILLFLAGGVVYLTTVAVLHDRHNESYQHEKEWAEKVAHRAIELASAPGRIPRAGALTLLKDDPYVQGPQIFADKCASCHRYDGHDGMGSTVEDEPSASDLKGFGSRDWVRGILTPDAVGGPKYFGATAHAEGEMVKWVQDNIPDMDPEDLELIITSLSAEAQLPYQAELDAADAEAIEEALENEHLYEMGRTDCHEYHYPDDTVDAPQLTGYASREWTIEFIANPGHERFYGEDNDRMPAYRKDGILSDRQIELVVDWLREDWYRPAVVEDAPLAQSGP